MNPGRDDERPDDRERRSRPRALLRRLRQALAAHGDERARLSDLVRLVADNMVAEVCSVYLVGRSDMLELAATHGLNQNAVLTARLRIGEGLVGAIAAKAEPINLEEARSDPRFRYIPETGEEAFRSFLGVPIQRRGRVLGVLTLQNRTPIRYDEDEVEALELVAAVIAEMAVGDALRRAIWGRADADAEGGAPPFHATGRGASDGVAIGAALLHEPRLSLPNPIAEDIDAELARLRDAMTALRNDVDRLLRHSALSKTGEDRAVMEAYRMFAHDSSWLQRLEENVESGLTAEAAVQKAQSAARARLERANNPYLRDRFVDLDDLAQRLLRRLTGIDDDAPPPENAILIARAIGPAELLRYPPGAIKAVALEEGARGAHVAIIARALDIPLAVQARGVLREAEQGDTVIVNGDQGHVHIRPRADVVASYREKLALRLQEKAAFASLRDLPAVTLDGAHVKLMINAGLHADLPMLDEAGADGVGLLRTELQFMLRARLPRRSEQHAFYKRILDAAGDRPVVFRTLDIGSDKVAPSIKQPREENPAMGWRAVRMGIDRPGLLKMQLQAMLRAASGRELRVMFPMVAEYSEFLRARDIAYEMRRRMIMEGREPPAKLRVGAMLEVPSLAYAPDVFFKEADFIAIGGNDLLQFFFAADRGNDRLTKRYDPLSPAFLGFLRHVLARAAAAKTPVSFCGEAAGEPLPALGFAAIGLRTLSMRAPGVGPVKRALIAADLSAARAALEYGENQGDPRLALLDWARGAGVLV